MNNSTGCAGNSTSHSRRNPYPTVDVIVYEPGLGVVLVRRNNPPPGWALPGGFVDYGETCEQAAVRELREETGLDVSLVSLLGVYSDPCRDPRMHTMSVVYIGQAVDASALRAGDDAGEAQWFRLHSLPETAFDHDRILADFIRQVGRLNPGLSHPGRK